MLIGVMSDSHGNMANIEKAVYDNPNVDVWIHAGDSIDDTYHLEDISLKKVYAVKGNNDIFTKGKYELIFDINDYKILLAHGHQYNVEFSIEDIKNKGISEQVDMAIFGHTHVGFLKNEDNIIFLNPGSISRPRDGKKPSYVIMEMENNKISEINFKYIK